MNTSKICESHISCLEAAFFAQLTHNLIGPFYSRLKWSFEPALLHSISAVLLPRACSVRQSTSCSKTKMEEQVDGKNSLIEHQLAPFAVIYHVLQTLTLKCALQEIAQLDLLCKQLYEATDAATRNAAERALANFTNSPDCLRKCQYLLERGNVSFSTFLRVIFSQVFVQLFFNLLSRAVMATKNLSDLCMTFRFHFLSYNGFRSSSFRFHMNV